MNKNSQRRSLPRRLPYEVVNWLKQLYAINPYPDRFQIGAMALHCKIETSRVQNWFSNRRSSDGRRGILCRQCRYFKSPLVSEELHRLYPYSRHCVFMLSIPQYFSQNLVNVTGLPMTSDPIPPRAPTAEVDYNGNNNPQIGSKHSIQDPFPVHPSENPFQTPNHHSQIPYNQITDSCQQQLPQLEPISHQLHASPKVQNFRQREEHTELDNAYEVAIINEIGPYSSNATYDGRQTCPPWALSQSTSIVSHNWMQNSAAATLAPIKLEGQEFAQQQSPDLNIEIYGEDYSGIVYPDYMDFPNFSLPMSNVNLQTF